MRVMSEKSVVTRLEGWEKEEERLDKEHVAQARKILCKVGESMENLDRARFVY